MLSTHLQRRGGGCAPLPCSSRLPTIPPCHVPSAQGPSPDLSLLDLRTLFRRKKQSLATPRQLLPMSLLRGYLLRKPRVWCCGRSGGRQRGSPLFCERGAALRRSAVGSKFAGCSACSIVLEHGVQIYVCNGCSNRLCNVCHQWQREQALRESASVGEAVRNALGGLGRGNGMHHTTHYCSGPADEGSSLHPDGQCDRAAAGARLAQGGYVASFVCE